MAYTTTQLITRAFYLSGIVRRDLQKVSGDQLYDGLNMLNAIISMKTADQRLIPYYKEYAFEAEAGEQKYFIPNLVLPETFTFYIGSVRYSTAYQTRKEYFATPRADNVTSLPANWHVERTLGGTDLYLYFTPDTNYPLVIWGKFSLQSVELGQDLSETLDMFYIEYLRYALAEYICQEYGLTFQPQAQQKLNEIESIIVDISPMDLTIDKVTTFPTNTTFNYAQVNIGRGHTPG